MKTKNAMRWCSILAILIAGYLLSGCNNSGNAKEILPKASPAEVGVVVIEAQPLPMTMELSGRISSHMVAEVRPQVQGIIKKRLFIEGSDVKAGQVLYLIDPATYQATYASAKAALSRAEANLIPARLKENRFKDLVKVNAVSSQDYDDVSAALKQAAADVEAAKATLESASINLTYCQVTAPITGRIGRSSVTTGALVTASQVLSLATIRQLDTVFVDVTQPSIEMLRLKRALASGELKVSETGVTAVKLLLEDGTLYERTGTLEFSEVSVDESTGSVTLRTVFPNPDKLLLPGMFVRTIIETGVKEQAILAPQRGVTHDSSGRAIALVVGKEDKVELRTLKVDRAVGDKWLVNEGLTVGDRLIVEGVQKARPGSPVKVIAFDDSPATVVPQPAVASK